MTKTYDDLTLTEKLVIDALRDTQRCEPDEDDYGMLGLPAEDLYDWASDLKMRVGLDTTEFELAIANHVAARGY